MGIENTKIKGERELGITKEEIQLVKDKKSNMKNIREYISDNKLDKDETLSKVGNWWRVKEELLKNNEVELYNLGKEYTRLQDLEEYYNRTNR